MAAPYSSFYHCIRTELCESEDAVLGKAASALREKDRKGIHVLNTLYLIRRRQQQLQNTPMEEDILLGELARTDTLRSQVYEEKR